MHEQNFEKGVRQKLEGLSLTPSVPVWDGVAAQVRRRSGRRRLLFWLLPMTLLIFLATWLLLTSPRSGVAKTHTENPAGAPLPANSETNNSTNGKIEERDANGPARVEPAPGGSIIAETQKGTVTQSDNKSGSQTEGPNKATPRRTPRAQRNAGSNSKQAEQTTADARKQRNTPGTTADGLSNTQTNIERPPVTTAPPSSLGNITASDSTAIIAALADTNTAIPQVDSLLRKTKGAERKRWSLGVVVAFGSSGMTTGLLDGLGEKAASDFSSVPVQNSAGGVASLPPSPVRRGSYFAVGLRGKYDLGKRAAFSAGLHYGRLSTEMIIGTLGDSALTSFRYASTYFNNDSVRRTYTNQYHFLTIPLSFHYQLHQKVPLNWSAGVTLSRLLSTNALHYNVANNIYYRDRSTIRKYAAGLSTGLSYHLNLGKRFGIEVGPQFQYHLTPALKGTTANPQHLYTIGIVSTLKIK